MPVAGAGVVAWVEHAGLVPHVHAHLIGRGCQRDEQSRADSLMLLARRRNHVQLAFPHLVEPIVAEPLALREKAVGHLERDRTHGPSVIVRRTATSGSCDRQRRRRGRGAGHAVVPVVSSRNDHQRGSWLRITTSSSVTPRLAHDLPSRTNAAASASVTA